MPRGRPRKVKTMEHLSGDEREELTSLNYDNDELALMEKRLAKNEWEFQSLASTLFINLSYEPDLILKSGKIVAGAENRTAKFFEKSYVTGDRKVAYLLYLSDAFMRQTIWDKAEREEAITEQKYVEFKEQVFADPDRLARLRADLQAEAK